MSDRHHPALEQPLYERDFVLWTEAQAAALRAEARRPRPNEAPAIDFDNLIEEVESLGRSERWQLVHRLGTLIEHLLKLEFSPMVEPRSGWRETVRRSRDEISELLEVSPSLRHDLPVRIEKVMRRTARRVAEDLSDRGELNAEAAAELRQRLYTEAQLLDGNWFPADR